MGWRGPAISGSKASRGQLVTVTATVKADLIEFLGSIIGMGIASEGYAKTTKN
jgi:hypothetical protein